MHREYGYIMMQNQRINHPSSHLQLLLHKEKDIKDRGTKISKKEKIDLISSI